MGFQDLFHRRSRKTKAENNDVTETVRTLIDARIDRLESNFQLLRGEWADAYEKLQLLYDRNRKRLKAFQVASDKEEPVNPTKTIPLTKEEILRRYNAQNGA